jgi:hypothetical protein
MQAVTPKRIASNPTEGWPPVGKILTISLQRLTARGVQGSRGQFQATHPAGSHPLNSHNAI